MPLASLHAAQTASLKAEQARFGQRLFCRLTLLAVEE
jgi:hypothetical protein